MLPLLLLLLLLLLSLLLLLLRHGRGWLACSLGDNNIGPEGASAIAEALKANSTLMWLEYVHGVLRVIVVGDLRLVWCCGAARALAQYVWCVVVCVVRGEEGEDGRMWWW